MTLDPVHRLLRNLRVHHEIGKGKRDAKNDQDAADQETALGRYPRHVAKDAHFAVDGSRNDVCIERGGRGRKFIEAVDWNRRMWLTLQMDLASDQNGLTDELRAQLISVAIWVDKHSSAALRGEAEIDPLITVNRTIMEGLAVRPGAPDPSPGSRPSPVAGGLTA